MSTCLFRDELELTDLALQNTENALFTIWARWAQLAKLKFTKDEEKYFIEHLYGRFAKKMTQSQANFLNETKDFSLAIYFNGNKGIEQFHQEQKDLLNKKS